jgi:hypothetical protein
VTVALAFLLSVTTTLTVAVTIAITITITVTITFPVSLAIAWPITVSAPLLPSLALSATLAPGGAAAPPLPLILRLPGEFLRALSTQPDLDEHLLPCAFLDVNKRQFERLERDRLAAAGVGGAAEGAARLLAQALDDLGRRAPPQREALALVVLQVDLESAHT